MAQAIDLKRRDSLLPRNALSTTGGWHTFTHDLILPVLLFGALGGMTWAVRGSSGFGAMKGCMFAGIVWGTAWWYLAHDPSGKQTRRYSSAWILLALTLGIGISGSRGWMQWPSFFDGKLMTNGENGAREFVPISRSYGFLWLFIAGMPWAGIGACALAWTGSLRPTRIWHWIIRLALGLFAATVFRAVYDAHHDWFLPLYSSIESRYNDLEANPSLRRLIGDCGSALYHLGWYVGFLLFEVLWESWEFIRGRRADWKNSALILTVGIVNGAGWALCQNWKWAPGVFGGDAKFNFWRCWESSGGISIGIAYGLAYFLCNRRMSEGEAAIAATRRSNIGPNFEWLLIFSGLTTFVFLFPQVRGELGGPRSLAFDYLLPQEADRWLVRHLVGWSYFYFSAILVFGGLYYVLYHRRSIDRTPVKTETTGLLDAFAGLVVAAALLLLPFWAQQWSRVLRPPMRSVLGRSAANWLFPENGEARFSLIYLAVIVGLGLVWYLCRQRAIQEEKAVGTPPTGDPNIERFALYLGLIAGLGGSFANGIKGWFNIYRFEHPEKWWLVERMGVVKTVRHWAEQSEGWFLMHLWHGIGPLCALLLVAAALWILIRPMARNYRGDVFRHAYAWTWLVLIVHYFLAWAITGPFHNWYEMAFDIYYLLLFFITAVIIVHFHFIKAWQARLETT